jgi:pimeloyl-ACP methyl ester carboxylesterase
LVHGFDGNGAKDCRELAPLASALRVAARREVVVVGYYAGDTGADVMLPGRGATTDTSIDEVGARLAAYLRAEHGRAPVDLVGHSMGGLVVQAALTGVPADAVRRIVAVGTPFGGLPTAVGCDAAQCVEMRPGSAWLRTLGTRGLRVDLAIGSEADADVPADSALAVEATRALRVPRDRMVDHGRLVLDPAVTKRIVRALRP